MLDAWFKSKSIGVALLDRQLRYVRINDALAALSPYTAAQHVGQDVRAMVPQLADIILPWLEEALRSGQPVLGCQVAIPGQGSGVLDVLPFADGILIVVVNTWSLGRAERAHLAPLLLGVLMSEVSAGQSELPATESGRGVDAALKIAGEALDFDRCFVGLFAKDRKEVRLLNVWAREPILNPVPETVAVNKFTYCLSRILAGQDFIWESSAPADPVVQAEAARLCRYSIASMVALPMRTGRVISGVVGFINTLGPRQYPTDVLTSLRLTVEIVASAFERKRQDEQRRARQEFDCLLARVSHDFVTAPTESLDQVVPRALADVGQTLHFDRALIYRRAPANPWNDLWHEWLAADTSSLRPELTRLDRQTYMPPSYVAGEGTILDLEYLPADAAPLHRCKQHNVRMMAMAPLCNAGQNFGTLMLHDKSLRAFPEDFRRQLTLLGELFASVISRIDAEQARQRAFKELEALKGHIERERDYLREEIRSDRQAGELLGHSPALRAVLSAIAAVAATQASVLIRGESGVGKELVARAIHDQSSRRDGPLVKVNCASVPRELFESEFFGHVRGSFTGAHKDRAGRFELADRGTLFLDEVGDIPLDLQAKLLRVLQEGEYERIGEDRTRKANVRVLAATNRNLEKDIAAGQFRSDLYYRLNTFPIELPPLRERGDDIIRLAQHFLSLFARNAGKRGLMLEGEQERLLSLYHWPGNVRELQQVIERAVILSSDSRLRLDLALPKLPPVPTAPPVSSVSPVLFPILATAPPMQVTQLRQLERDNIVVALEQVGWRIAGPGGAAELLAIKPSTLRDRIRALGIERSR